MDERRRTGRFRFWALALVWLPGGIIVGEVLRTGSAYGMMTRSSLVALSAAAPCGVPLVLACRRLGRLGYPGPALVAWMALGAAAVAGLLVPLSAGVQTLLVFLPVWVGVWCLKRRPRCLEFAPSSRRPGSRKFRSPFRP